MALSEFRKGPLDDLRKAIAHAVTVNPRYLIEAVKFNLDRIAFQAEPGRAWQAAAARVSESARGLVAAVQSGYRIDDSNRAALASVDALAAALEGVPSREEARNNGMGW